MNYKHGQDRKGQVTSEYLAWRNMKQRCTNQNYEGFKNYGGRGISVCESWYKFENFFADMGKRPEGLTLDRKNNDGNYEPGNCQWATLKEQANNKRKHKKCKDRKDQYWFYGCGPNGEIIVENNQCEVARHFRLNQAHITACLNGRAKTHKGWLFQRIHKKRREKNV